MPDVKKVIKGLEVVLNDIVDGYITEPNMACNTINDALALLKAQEPRVMTLEEVKMLDSDYYYLESMRSPGKELREIVGAYGLTCVTWPSITWARQTMGDSGYGKTWRCWTSRPDEKRRAETLWN